MTAEQQKLVEENHNLIYLYLHKHRLPIEEFYSVAAIGLCNAAIAYNPERYKFSTLAMRCIDGAIKSELRYYRNMKYIPENAYMSLSSRVFDNDNGDKQLNLEDVIPDEYDMENDIIVGLIFDDFLAGLSDENRRILALYVEGMTQEDIGAELGMARNTVNYRMKCMCRDLKLMLEGGSKG